MEELQAEKYAEQQQLLATLGEIHATTGGGQITVTIGFHKDGIADEILISEAPGEVINILVTRLGYSVKVVPEGALIHRL